MRSRNPGRGSKARSKSAASRSRSAMTSASRASATASRASVSGVSETVVRSCPDRSETSVRTLSGTCPDRSEAHLSSASVSICQVFRLSRWAGKSPEERARMIELRPHPARSAACLGERNIRSMTGPWTGHVRFAILFLFRADASGWGHPRPRSTFFDVSEGLSATSKKVGGGYTPGPPSP